MSETFEEWFDGLYPGYKVFITPSGRSLKYDMRELWDARQQEIDKLERELEQFPDYRWMEKYYDKVEELNRAERDNEVLKKALEWIEAASDGVFSCYNEKARQALSKIRSEG